ncbi:aldehyde dehydrogenase family protein, partial [Escherichia coli]|uniref:aldehyde dehydrogenase family protein n=1 Tax=Escherichia coli TaxID=562 RepID=UPI0024C3CC8A
THVGPLINDKHRQSVLEYVELAKREGGSVLCGGEIPADPALAAGSYFLPTIIEGLNNQARVCQEEIFGPVLVATPFDDLDEAVRLANDSIYGLGASIWSNDLRQVMDLVPRIKAGTVWVNAHNLLDPSMPFGGFKQSGIGREMGHAAIEAYTENKSVCIAY